MLGYFKNVHYNIIQIVPEYDQKLKIIFSANIVISYMIVIKKERKLINTNISTCDYTCI